MKLHGPRLTVAGLSGDSGKTLVSLGLGRALRDRGLAVQAFKKGPDYIDAAWLSAATGSACRNLDTFMMSNEAITTSVAAVAAADFLLIEGNRGLYDGVDADGRHSTAELAKIVGSPVVLVVDVTKATRTVAALVLGCAHLDTSVDLAGVILNRVGTARQEAVIRQAVEEAVDVPVLGAIPRLRGDDPLPSRHLGLTTVAESPRHEEAIVRAAAAVSEHVDLDRVLELAGSAPTLELTVRERSVVSTTVRLGYFSDQAFSFYYPENLDGLRAAGAELVPVSPGREPTLPDVDGLYIGGGFPEVHAPDLAANRGFVEDLRRQVEAGLPVYAECGGLMYLARELVMAGATYPMAAVLDLVVEQTARPQGHGYEEARVDMQNPFLPVGMKLKGHEFHYSHIIAGADAKAAVLEVLRGQGIGGGRDGIVKGRVWASYLHLHAMATPCWADGLLSLAAGHAARRQGSAPEAWD